MSGTGVIEAIQSGALAVVLQETAPGHVWVVRAGIWVALAAVVAWGRRTWLAALLAAALAASVTWLGHAGAQGSPAKLAVDAAHLLAAGVWPAGLVPFALLLRRRLRDGDAAGAREAVRRFSAMSLGAVAVLAASGIVNAWVLVGSFHALVASDYGRVLMLKAALFCVALALGAWNLLRLKPQLEAESRALEAIRRNVWIEAALASAIVLVVAVLGTLPPTRGM
jgi:putative copper resistance protein D